MTTKILLVEDNPDNTKLFTWILEDAEYQVIHADSGESALNLVINETFDIILMDIGLPGISGEDATRKLRKQEAFKKIPIIALTAHALTDEVDHIMSAGFTELITKPIAEEEFLETIKKTLSGDLNG